MRRPKDMTREELEALPHGPMRFNEVVLDTEEKLKKYPSLKLGDTIRIPIMELGRVTELTPDDIAVCALSDGTYTFGQFADGTWYKRSMPI